MLVKQWHWYQQTNPQETAFSLNALSIDENTVMFPGYDKEVFTQLAKHNVECINLNLKTCYFWDNGLHCFTNELHRQGDIENYF
jgi:N-dimethylarginine dimethylaminohydrolase